VALFSAKSVSIFTSPRSALSLFSLSAARSAYMRSGPGACFRQRKLRKGTQGFVDSWMDETSLWPTDNSTHVNRVEKCIQGTATSWMTPRRAKDITRKPPDNEEKHPSEQNTSKNSNEKSARVERSAGNPSKPLLPITDYRGDSSEK
jgi:hypothetical protein